MDAVEVCLHNNLHAPVTIEALKAGRHVYCEKPIAGSYRDGAEMVKVAKETGKMLHIQLFSFYTKETKAAKRLIEVGALGKLYHGRSTGYRRRGRPFVDGYGTDNFVQKEKAGGGALFDMGVYHIGGILYLMGQPKIKNIVGRAYQETEMDAARRKSSKYDVEELAMGFITFARNFKGFIFFIIILMLICPGFAAYYGLGGLIASIVYLVRYGLS